MDTFYLVNAVYSVPHLQSRIFVSPDPIRNLRRATSGIGYCSVEEIILVYEIDGDRQLLQRIRDPHAVFDFMAKAFCGDTTTFTNQVM